MSDHESQLTFYSLGIVVADKAPNSRVARLYPVEALPFIDGSISDHKNTLGATLPNAKGSTKTSSLEGGAVLEANWLPFGCSNRATPPDLCKNETVAIWKYSNTDEYHWTTIFDEPSLRRLEHVSYMFSNLRSGMNPYDKNKSYWIEVSTRDKHIHLHTSTSDGEPFEYDIILDTGAGTFSVADSAGNNIALDSRAGTLVANIVNHIEATVPTATWNADVTINGKLVVRDTVQAGGNINSSGEIIDSTGKSMSDTRTVHNNHNHNDPQGGVVSTPNQQM